MDTFLIKAAQLILAFAILVIIHEFGHFLFARIFGVRVEKFYIFFDPWKEIFKWKPKKYIGFFGGTKKLKAADAGDIEVTAEDVSAEVAAIDKKDKKKKDSFWGNTEYGIGWLPLGGYCKISGMIDESMDTEQMKKPPQPWEFRSKPAWQRLLIMIAGVLFNFLLAILIYAGIVYTTGEKYVPFHEAKMGMSYSESAKQIGFRDGDIPLSADGKKVNNIFEIKQSLINAKNFTVLRDGKDTVNIAVPENFIFLQDKEIEENPAAQFIEYRFPVKIKQAVSGEPAAKAGIENGDIIIAIDSVATPALGEFYNALAGHENQTVALTVVRPNGTENDTIVKNVTLTGNSKLGVQLEADPSAFYNYEEKHYGLLESIPRGIQLGTSTLSTYASSLTKVFSKEGASQVGGFGSIGSMFPDSWDWIAFWNIAAILSVALAVMNILPIPALDGGHVLFLLYEVIFRRKPSEKFLERAQYVGMTLLILLLLYANGMDIVRFFIK